MAIPKEIIDKEEPIIEPIPKPIPIPIPINDDLSVKEIGEITIITELTKPIDEQINIAYTQKDNMVYVISRVDSQHILSDEFGDAKYMISTIIGKTPTEAVDEVKEIFNIKTIAIKEPIEIIVKEVIK
jgi:hypothetical protein